MHDRAIPCEPLGIEVEDDSSIITSQGWPSESLEPVKMVENDDAERDDVKVSEKGEEIETNRCRATAMQDEKEEKNREETEDIEDYGDSEAEEDTLTSHSASSYRDIGPSMDEEMMVDIATDQFHSAADNESQATRAQEISDLNSAVNHLVLDILSRFDSWIERYYRSEFKEVNSPRGSAGKNTPLLRTFFKLKKPQRLQMHRTALEVHMKDRILSTLYKTFFAGDVFFGVMDDTQINILSKMYYMLLKNQPWTTVQRWRAISSTASVMPMDATSFANIVNDIIQEIMGSVETLYHTKSASFYKTLTDVVCNTNGSSDTMLNIVQRAHKLSRNLQHDHVSARLKVTLAPVDQNGALLPFSPDLASPWAETSGRRGRRMDAVLATAAFGLESFEGLGNTHRVLMKPVVVTATIFE